MFLQTSFQAAPPSPHFVSPHSLTHTHTHSPHQQHPHVSHNPFFHDPPFPHSLTHSLPFHQHHHPPPLTMETQASASSQDHRPYHLGGPIGGFIGGFIGAPKGPRAGPRAGPKPPYTSSSGPSSSGPSSSGPSSSGSSSSGSYGTLGTSSGSGSGSGVGVSVGSGLSASGQLQRQPHAQLQAERFKNGKIKKVKGPKGYVSGFNFFAVHIRSRKDLQDKIQNQTNNETNIMIGQMWKSLQKDGKAIFYQEAEDDKIRYLREVHFHNESHPCAIIPKIDPPLGYDIRGQLLPVADGNSAPLKNSKGGKDNRARTSIAKPIPANSRKWDDSNSSDGCFSKGSANSQTEMRRQKQSQQPHTVQRPRTAYSLFAHQEKDLITGLNCPDLQRCMGKYLGSRWRNMPAAERRMYELLEESGATVNKKSKAI